jgi:hypothetical protein
MVDIIAFRVMAGTILPGIDICITPKKKLCDCGAKNIQRKKNDDWFSR